MSKKASVNFFRLHGKTAFITGATGYFGSKFSLTLARHGAHVIINGRNLKKLESLRKKIKLKGGSVSIANFDILNFNDLKKFTSKIKKIDILINNAYDSSANQKSRNLKKYNENFYKSFLINVLAANNLIKNLEKKLTRNVKSKQTSSVINIGSIYGIRCPDFGVYEAKQNPNPEYYGSSKAALIQLKKYYSVKLAKKKIRVNTISPGAFPNKDTIKKFPIFAKKILKKIPLQRIGTPEDLLSAVLYLSSESSSYVTGTNIKIDGGWSAW